ncbi:MAG TPA: M20/M25/M40 family metallo-hydrolase [Chryseosolibacter sp.]|nr:M20/M25/M40 family metallo-hydrolase [Chryseosolibacter sp.]
MYKVITWIICCTLAIGGSSAFAQPDGPAKVRAHWQSKQRKLIDEYMSFLSIPNVVGDTVNIARNAKVIMQMMANRGIGNVQLLKGKTPHTPPAVYGEVIVPGAKQTLIFYAHYDGQPVNPAQWADGLEPFSPRLYSGPLAAGGQPIDVPAFGNFQGEWRLYARAASDDKAGIFAILNAYEAVATSGLKLNYNIKFFFEGEEEAGSPHLHEILDLHRNLLQSDLWIICDGPVHQTGRKVVSFGVRGDAHVDITVYGPKRPLHSGHYGNWAPNPALMLARLLATMKDESGKVLIADFYDDVKPLSDAERDAIRKMPEIETQMKSELGLAAAEMKDRSIAESVNLPSLNINGIQSGNVGKMSSNVIPTIANAVLDLRLVPGNDWKRQQQKVIDHIRAQGYYVIDRDPTDHERKTHEKIAKVIAVDNGYNAQRTPMTLPIAQKVIAAVQSTTSDDVVLIPTSGGSLPLYLFEQYLQAKTIAVPIANHDNNQHAENENIRLSNLFAGIETMAAVMSMR